VTIHLLLVSCSSSKNTPIPFALTKPGIAGFIWALYDCNCTASPKIVPYSNSDPNSLSYILYHNQNQMISSARYAGVQAVHMPLKEGLFGK
jgi:hypothetical protein